MISMASSLRVRSGLRQSPPHILLCPCCRLTYRLRLFERSTPPRLLHALRAGAALFRGVHHVVDAVHNRLVGKIGPAAFRWHHADFALKPFKRCLMQHCQALSDARRPRSFVTKLRCAGKSGAVTSDTSRVCKPARREHGRGGRWGRSRWSCITRIERGVVPARRPRLSPPGNGVPRPVAGTPGRP